MSDTPQPVRRQLTLAEAKVVNAFLEDWLATLSAPPYSSQIARASAASARSALMDVCPHEAGPYHWCAICGIDLDDLDAYCTLCRKRGPHSPDELAACQAEYEA